MMLVTGATGFLGRALLAALMERHPGNQPAIRVLARNPQAVPAWWKVDVVAGDIRDFEAVDLAVRGCDQIIHLAGLTHARSATQYHAVNTEGTRILVNASRRHGIRRLVLVSTRAIDSAGGGYSLSKHRAEQLVAQSIEDFVIVRLGEVYGDLGGGGIADLIAWLRCHWWVPVIGRGNYELMPLHVDDAAAAIIGALEQGVKGHTYTMTGPESVTYNQLVDSIAQALQVRRVKIHLPTWLAHAGVRVIARFPSSRLAYDQVTRLVSPKSLMSPKTPETLGLTLRRFSSELPNLVARAQGSEDIVSRR